MHSHPLYVFLLGPRALILSFLAATALLAGCIRARQPFSNTPVISFVRVSPDTLSDARSLSRAVTLSVTISFQDGDGNLGRSGTTGSPNFYYNDNRPGYPLVFPPPVGSTDSVVVGSLQGGVFPKASPSDNARSIEGTITLLLPLQSRLNIDNTFEVGSYDIFILDEAGNISNTIRTTPVVFKE